MKSARFARTRTVSIQRFLIVLIAVSASLVGCSSGSDEPTPTPPVNTSDNPTTTSGAQSNIIPTAQVFPYRPNSRYANTLKECVLIGTVAESCTLLTLPLIGQENPAPSVENVLDRVLVTHQWMGDRFAQLLNDAPADLMHLFGSTTAILIGSEVRPSFYTTLNGAIQLDPVYLWLTVDEKRSISIADDFRRNFGAELKFLADWEWVRDERRATQFFSLENDSVRNYADIVIPTMRLLYHELAHANDFVPSETRAGLDVGQSIYDAISNIADQRHSTRLYQIYPLLDEQMLSLAQVRFRDTAPTELEKTLQADYVGSLMGNDGATTFYSYLTEYEDLANLLEASMMTYHYGINLNVGFEVKPTDPKTCSDYIVGWGMRNRLGAEQVLPRAKWVTDNMVGTSAALDQFFAANNGATTLMRPGEDWCSNRVVNPSPVLSAERIAESKQEYQYGYDHHIH